MSVPPITADSIIDIGMPISDNFNINHLTTGARHNIIGEWIPRFTSTLIPNMQAPLGLSGGLNLPLWQIVSNLQTSANGMLEGLLGAYGSDLIIRAGFLNNIPFNGLPNEISHLTGSTFDIQIKGFESNMYGIAKDMSKLMSSCDNLNLVFGSQSWIHATVNPQRIGVSGLSAPSFTSSDLATGITSVGLSAIRGFL